MNNNIVYVGMAGDIIHYGHVNIIKEASKYGLVTIGLLTDDAIISYKRTPIVNFENGKKVIEQFKDIYNIIPQNTLDYTENLLKIKPKYVVHGDDWKTGPQQKTREKIIKLLENWDGKLIEIPYTQNISTTEIIEKINSLYIYNDKRIN